MLIGTMIHDNPISIPLMKRNVGITDDINSDTETTGPPWQSG